VLFRAASHSAALEIELARRNIPFRKYGGLRFLEAAHIKDLVSFLRVLENPQDELAWFRILQLITGIGPSTAAAAFGFVRENGFDSTAIARFTAPAPACAELAQMGALFGDLRNGGSDGPAVHIERIRTFYTPLLQRNYDNAEARSNDLAHLEQLAAGYTSRKKFLADLILDPPSSTGELAGPPSLDEDWLVLSTIHSAKGCEWDCVYLIHAADGCLPSDMATGSQEELEEELRLTYVAMTRARDFLYLLWPLRYYTRPTGYSDRHTYAQCSRFFSAAVREGMQIIEQLPENNSGDSAADVRPGTDIGGLIRGMWD
jgi:DNA helicase-2/ATP-dependent DNA helicase PcrA